MLIQEVSVMSTQSRCFPYEKSIVINALYDTIEELGLSLDSANSIRGTLIVSDAKRMGKMRIALICGANANQTHVKFFLEDSSSNFVDMWSLVILDELTGRLKHVHKNKRG